jgi:hypothetical protein
LASEDRIPPGGEGKIKTTLRTGTYKGNVNKSIKIKSNDPTNNLLVVYLKTFVEVDLDINPERLKFYPKTGEKIEYEVFMTNKIDKPIQIKNIESSHEYVIVENDIQVLKPKEAKSFRVYLKDNPGPGRFNGKLFITTDLPKHPNYNVRFWGKIPEKKEASPKQSDGNK